MVYKGCLLSHLTKLFWERLKELNQTFSAWPWAPPNRVERHGQDPKQHLELQNACRFPAVLVHLLVFKSLHLDYFSIL